MSTIYGRGTAEMWIKPAIDEAGITSADKYYDWLREHGQYVTRDTVRQVWREHGEATRYSDYLERYATDLPIPRAWYAESESEYISRYGVRVSITEQDPITGETTEDSYFFKSDEYVSVNKIRDWVESLSPDTSPPILGSVSDFKIEATYHRAGAGW